MQLVSGGCTSSLLISILGIVSSIALLWVEIVWVKRHMICLVRLVTGSLNLLSDGFSSILFVQWAFLIVFKTFLAFFNGLAWFSGGRIAKYLALGYLSAFLSKRCKWPWISLTRSIQSTAFTMRDFFVSQRYSYCFLRTLSPKISQLKCGPLKDGVCPIVMVYHQFCPFCLRHFLQCSPKMLKCECDFDVFVLNLFIISFVHLDCLFLSRQLLLSCNSETALVSLATIICLCLICFFATVIHSPDRSHLSYPWSWCLSWGTKLEGTTIETVLQM